ncbi:MAG: PIG-L family deacetylase [Bryobacteraceae bacterium]
MRRTVLVTATLCLLLAPAGFTQQRTILAIGAHCGDAEITTGALLAKHRKLGDRIAILHLTLGEGGNPRMTPAAYGEQKRNEALAAAKVLDAEAIFGPYKDGELPVSSESVRYVANVIRRVKPTHVLTHWRNSMHRDHTATYRIVSEAVLLASLEGFVSEYPRHRGLRGVYYAENWEDAEDFKPFLYVDVSAELDQWEKCVTQYEFIRGGISSYPYLDYYKSLARVRGSESGKRYAISFEVDPWSRRRVIDALP